MTDRDRFPVVHLGGMDVTTASRRQLVDAMVADGSLQGDDRKRPLLVVDANGHALSLRATDAAYRAAVDQADVVHADGGFLVVASRWLTDAPIVERSATTDLIYDAAAAAARHGLSFFLLGGTEEVNAECARVLESQYPGLRVVGRQHGFFHDLDAVSEAIRESGADVVWVGMGKPREQQIGVALRDTTTAAWIITCGGCFNFVTGAYRRAPTWMQEAHLEWLHRLLSQPRKLFWRYLVTNPHALFLVLARSRRARRG